MQRAKIEGKSDPPTESDLDKTSSQRGEHGKMAREGGEGGEGRGVDLCGCYWNADTRDKSDTVAPCCERR